MCVPCSRGRLGGRRCWRVSRTRLSLPCCASLLPHPGRSALSAGGTTGLVGWQDDRCAVGLPTTPCLLAARVGYRAPVRIGALLGDCRWGFGAAVSRGSGGSGGCTSGARHAAPQPQCQGPSVHLPRGPDTREQLTRATVSSGLPCGRSTAFCVRIPSRRCPSRPAGARAILLSSRGRRLGSSCKTCCAPCPGRWPASEAAWLRRAKQGGTPPGPCWLHARGA